MRRARAVATLLRLSVLPLVALAGGIASAQDQGQRKPGITITLRGLGTMAPTVFGRPRHFVPITVVLQNDGPADADGLLRVYRSQEVAAGVAFSSVPEQGLFYERAIKVPRRGKRIEELFYYCQDREPDRLCVAFETSTGETVVAAPHPKLDLRAADVLALSVTSSDQDDAVALGGGVVAGPRRSYELQVKHADPASLPERPEGYGAFDLVIISDLDTRSISEQQARALKEWVELGGDLLVAFSGKTSEGMGALDDSILPALPAAGEAVRADDLRLLEPLVPDSSAVERVRTPIRRVVPKPGARVLGGTGDEPLIVRGRLGAGRVTYFAFQLAALKSTWGTDKDSGGRQLLALAAHAPYEDLESFQPPPIAPPLEEVLLNLSEAITNMEPPSALLVAPLLILYVTLVAPLNYVILTRLGKRDLATLTAAAVAVVFGAVFYGLGWYKHGSGSLVARAAIVELPAVGTERARVDTMTGFFSTDLGVVDAKIPKGATVAPLAERPNGRGAHVVEPAGADPSLKEIEVATWSLRRFKTTRLESVGTVVADLHYEGSKIVGTVENQTSWNLEAPVILIGTRFLELTDLKPGAKVVVSQVPQSTQDRNVSLALEQRMLRSPAGAFKARFGDGAGYGAGAQDPYQGDSAARFRATLTRRLRAMDPGPGALPALFACCVEKDMGGVDVDASATLELGRALVLSELSVAASDGELSFKDLTPRVYRAKNYEPSLGTTGSFARLFYNSGTTESGAVTYEWRLPASVDAPFVAKSLEANWQLATDPDREQVTLYGYDWAESRLPPNKAQAQLEGRRSSWTKSGAQTQRLVHSESGIVRLQLESAMSDFYIDDLTLSVSGTRVPRTR